MSAIALPFSRAKLSDSTVAQLVVWMATAAAVALVLPKLFDAYWLSVLITGAIAVVTMQSLGVIVGRAGVLCVCQLTFIGVGSWVTQWANVHHVPGGFFAWAALGTLGALLFGVVVGLLALRLRGATLAVATLAVATAMDIIWSASVFPGEATYALVNRPTGFISDPAYFGLVVAIVAVVFWLLRMIDRTRLGASWIEARFSEHAAAAHGINVPVAKVSAFAVSAAIAGLSGALQSGNLGLATATSFPPAASITLLSIAILFGVHHIEAAIMGGVMSAVFPAVLVLISVPQDYAPIAFGVLAMFVLKAGKGQFGQSDMVRAKYRARQASRSRAVAVATPAARPTLDVTTERVAQHPRFQATALAVTNVSVRFGSVVAVDGVTLGVPTSSIVALVGPNGAGKSTLIDAITGFVSYTGSISVNGVVLDGRAPHRRARAGVRRSFQQLRVAPSLTVGMFVTSVAGRRMTGHEIDELLAWFGCPPRDVYIGAIDVGARRILEVAALAASEAPLLLLDEPAAGQAAEDSARLAHSISEIPKRTGSAVVLVEHDMNLIRETCQSVAVMEAGSLLAVGETSAVLRDPEVVRAYIGDVRDSGLAPALEHADVGRTRP